MSDHARKLVYVLDDDAAVRDSVCTLLTISGYDTEAFATAADFRHSFRRGKPVCALLDVRLPDADGLAVNREMRHTAPELPVIIMTGHADVPMAVEAMRDGACDFIEKPFDAARMLASVERASSRGGKDGGQSSDPDATERFTRLTPRETDILYELIAGHSNKIIGHHLGLSPRTVEIHRARVMKKTEAKSLSHLVRMALKAGYDPDAGGGDRS